MIRTGRFVWILVSLGLMFPAVAGAEVKLPAIIGEHMVLQQHRSVPIWGTAGAGEKVTVSFRGKNATATADPNGNWLARVDAQEAGGPFELTIAGSSTIKFTDILVGEVWICSGQSNMQFGLKFAKDGEKEVAEANFPTLRLFSVERTPSVMPLKDVKGEWEACTPESSPMFSAVGYFFGRDLLRDLKVPIGMIHTSWGGTPSEAWTTREKLQSIPTARPLLERLAKVVADYPEAKKKFDADMAAWEAAANKAKSANQPEPAGKPNPPAGPETVNQPAVLYNGMIAPLVPYGIKGAIWYQGEANTDRGYQYRDIFPGMINNWRDAWGEGDFPFLFVQLTNFTERKTEHEVDPGESAWAELREAQTRTLALPNTGMATTIDIGVWNDIHPKNKQDVGHRLAGAARFVAYGDAKAVPSGPMYKSVSINNNEARVTFQWGNGLQVKGEGPPKGFAIAGADHKFYWAEAKIDGHDIVLHCDKVPNPVAVRYAWADNPNTNLYNGAGLPAVPFRTDDWPGITLDKN